MVITQNGRKNYGVTAFLWEICQISLKWAPFARFPSADWVEFYKSWLKSNKFQSFRLILQNVNLIA